MAGRKGSSNLAFMFFMLMATSSLLGISDAEEHSPSLLRGNSSPKLGTMSFNEDWNSGAPMTCTCNCYPAPGAPPKAPSPQSPEARKRSPPPAPYYQSPPPSPVYERPAPPAGSTTSPVTFTSPPPTAPGYGQPAPPSPIY